MKNEEYTFVPTLPPFPRYSSIEDLHMNAHCFTYQQRVRVHWTATHQQVAVKEKTIPKTTSGKIQRRQTRTLLHNGGLNVVCELSDAAGSATTAAASSIPRITPTGLPVPDAQQPAPSTTATATVAQAKAEVVAASESPAASPYAETSSQTSADDSSSSSDNHTSVRAFSQGSKMD